MVTRSKSPPLATTALRSSSLMNCWYRLPNLARRAYDWPSERSEVARVWPLCGGKGRQGVRREVGKVPLRLVAEGVEAHPE